MRKLTVDSLSCSSPTRSLLVDVSFALHAGEILGLVGASGSGKSLTMHALVGLVAAPLSCRGALRIEGEGGESIFDLGRAEALAPLRGHDLALLAQAAASTLDPVLRVGAQLREVQRRWQDRRAPEDRMIEVGLTAAHLDRYPHQCSGGEAQRVCLALALAAAPAVILADEPTASLDAVSQAAVMTTLQASARARGIAMILVSHDLAMVAAIADRIAVIDGGVIVESGEVGEVLRDPQAPATRRLCAAARGIDVR